MYAFLATVEQRETNRRTASSHTSPTFVCMWKSTARLLFSHEKKNNEVNLQYWYMVQFLPHDALHSADYILS